MTDTDLGTSLHLLYDRGRFLQRPLQDYVNVELCICTTAGQPQTCLHTGSDSEQGILQQAMPSCCHKWSHQQTPVMLSGAELSLEGSRDGLPAPGACLILGCDLESAGEAGDSAGTGSKVGIPGVVQADNTDIILCLIWG